MKNNHTPEPWVIKREERTEPVMPFGKFESRKKILVGSGEGTISDPFHIVHETIDNGEIDPDTARIVACVNALAGMDPEAVAGVVDALGKIAYEPIGDPEATHQQILAECVTIAGNALAALRGEGGE